MVAGEITPKNDATLGLIFRLNALWARVDLHAESGKYDSWNNVLDSLYRNLLYREAIIVEKDEEENILKVDLCDNDKKEYEFLNRKISRMKLLYMRYKNSDKKNKKGIPIEKIARSLWYKAIGLKDIWLRKLMQTLNLYIKETTKTPGSAMFGR